MIEPLPVAERINRALRPELIAYLLLQGYREKDLRMEQTNTLRSMVRTFNNLRGGF